MGAMPLSKASNMIYYVDWGIVIISNFVERFNEL